MKEMFANIRYTSLSSYSLGLDEEGVGEQSPVEPHDIADLAGVSQNLILMHWILERSSATGHP